jgi:hypothetical protein
MEPRDPYPVNTVRAAARHAPNVLDREQRTPCVVRLLREAVQGSFDSATFTS